jgi:hypothetical protein
MPECHYIAAPRDEDNPYLTARAPISDAGIVPAGTFAGVCCDVVWVDPATIQSRFPNPRGLVQLKWQLGIRHDVTGKRFVVSRLYTKSLGWGAKLRRDVEGWLGRPLSYSEARHGLDLERWFLGRPALLLCDRKAARRGGRITVVIGVQPYPDDEPPLVVEDYVRVKDRRRTNSS